MDMDSAKTIWHIQIDIDISMQRNMYDDIK